MSQPRRASRLCDVQPEDLDERVATRADYPALRPLLSKLRNRDDANPAMISPYDSANAHYGTLRDAMSNCARYMAEHPDAEAVKCFRVWMCKDGQHTGGIAVSAQFHLVILHEGRYVEVSPPEQGDEDKNFMIVPTSRAYPQWTAKQMIEIHYAQRLRLLLGGVFYPQTWLEFQQSIRGPERAQADAAGLVAYARPYVYDLPSYCPREIFKELAEVRDNKNRLLFKLEKLLALIDAKRWIKEDKPAGSGQKEEEECVSPVAPGDCL